MKRFVLSLLTAMFIACAFCTFPVGSAQAESKGYYIQVDITNQYVTVYRKSDMVIVRQMICSTGTNATPTPQGVYTMPARRRADERKKWYTFADCYGQYASRINGPYLFHSYLFYAKRDSAVIQSSVNALGSQASHGCIRLRIPDAKWIAQNCPAGTRVKIFKSGKRNNEIRKLLLKGTYSISSGKSYEEWAGIGGEGELGRGDVGTKVMKLQNRLVGMGWVKMKADGIYGQNTLDAVKAFQKKVGLEADGVTDPKTWDALFADDAPAGSVKVTLYEGTSGEIVKQLQQTLATLKFYDGKIDGEFDSEVTQAVNRYRTTHNLSSNGQLNFTNRQKAEDEAKALLEKFGDAEYKIVYEEYDIPMARLKKNKSHIYLRKKQSTTAKQLMKIVRNSEMKVVEKGDKWTKVSVGDKTGFVQTKYINYYAITKQRVRYELVNAPEEPTVPEDPETPEVPEAPEVPEVPEEPAESPEAA